MYWETGRVIVEEKQQGSRKAGYKLYLLDSLARQLVSEFGDGFSKRQLELCRQLYIVFPIANTLYSQLTWSHYKVIVRMDDVDKLE